MKILSPGLLGLLGVVAACGGGSGPGPAPARLTTGSDGTASTQRNLGSGAGRQTTAATVTGIIPVVSTHTAPIQGATQISASGSITRSDTVLSTAPFTAVVRDQHGTPVQHERYA